MGFYGFTNPRDNSPGFLRVKNLRIVGGVGIEANHSEDKFYTWLLCSVSLHHHASVIKEKSLLQLITINYKLALLSLNSDSISILFGAEDDVADNPTPAAP